jgi:hypothetical protein
VQNESSPRTAVLAVKPACKFFGAGLEQKENYTKEITWPGNSIFGYSRNACTTVFDRLPKRQNEANEETLIKTMIQHEQDNQEKYQTSYLSLIVIRSASINPEPACRQFARARLSFPTI